MFAWEVAKLLPPLSLSSLQMIDGGGTVSPSLHGQVERSSGGSGASMCWPATADRDILVYQQLTNLMNAGYTEVSTNVVGCYGTGRRREEKKNLIKAFGLRIRRTWKLI